MKNLPPFDGRLYDELGELLELPEGASYKEFARRLRRLYTDLETQNRVLVRLERGQFDNAYPALTEFLSELTNEEKETFLFTGGLQSILPLEERTKKPWDAEPYEGDSEWYRDDLHDGIYTSGDPEDVPSLAAEWLEELARIGYRGVVLHHFGGKTYQFPARQKMSSGAIPQPLRVSAKAGPANFNEGRQLLWLELEAGRSERGHREIKLNDEPLRTDAAILAALMAMECRPVVLDQLHEVLSALPRPLETPFWKQGYLTPTRGVREVPEPRTLDLTMMLLRYHKPYFDDLSEAERAELLERACGHINEFFSALRRVIAFLDYGVPGRQLRSAKGEAEKHIEAAVLKHVYGFSNAEIAGEMGEPVAQKQKVKNDPATVRQWVRLGTRLMENAMGKERWQAQVEAMRAEAERWNNLSEDEQEAEVALELYAEARRISLNQAEDELDQDHHSPTLTSIQKIRLEAAREARELLEESRTNPDNRD